MLGLSLSFTLKRITCTTVRMNSSAFLSLLPLVSQLKACKLSSFLPVTFKLATLELMVRNTTCVDWRRWSSSPPTPQDLFTEIKKPSSRNSTEKLWKYFCRDTTRPWQQKHSTEGLRPSSSHVLSSTHTSTSPPQVIKGEKKPVTKAGPGWGGPAEQGVL